MDIGFAGGEGGDVVVAVGGGVSCDILLERGGVLTFEEDNCWEMNGPDGRG